MPTATRVAGIRHLELAWPLRQARRERHFDSCSGGSRGVAEVNLPRKGNQSQDSQYMSVLYNHAIRWDFVHSNPITGPVRGSGVRQSAKREHIPDVLEVGEFQALLGEHQLRERV